MQASGASQSPPEYDGDKAMGVVLAHGAAIGIPTTFVVTVGLLVAAGATWPGLLAIAAWAALVGGTFCGGALILAKKMAELDESSRGYPVRQEPIADAAAPAAPEPAALAKMPVPAQSRSAATG